jgi:hypothetical protein
MLDDDGRKYLDLIQSTISRLAGNSFQLKSWSVGLGSAIIGLAAKDAQSRFSLVALVPVLAFCGLDAYYLGLERLFRRRFNSAAGLTEPAPRLYDMNVGSVPASLWFACLARSSIWMTHGPIASIAILVGLLGPGHA